MNEKTQRKRIFGEGKKRDNIMKHFFVYSFLAIPIIHFLIFWVAVNAESLLLPFQDGETGAFTLNNFKRVFEAFKTGGEINIAFRNSFIYWVTGIITSYVLALSVSYFIWKKIFMYRVLTFLFMVPSMVSSVVLVAIYKNLISTTGPIAVVYEALFDKAMPPLLYSNDTATWTIAAFCMWTGFGMNVILYSGAFAKIPQEIVEAAQIDGAGFFKEFIYVDFPLILPTVLTLLIFEVSAVLLASGPILLFTGGMYETTTISYWFYERVIVERDYGVSSAFGLLLSAVAIPLVFFVRHIANKVEVVEY